MHPHDETAEAVKLAKAIANVSKDSTWGERMADEISGLALELFQAKHVAEAKTLFLQVRELFRTICGEQSYEYALALANLALCLDRNECKATLQESLKICQDMVIEGGVETRVRNLERNLKRALGEEKGVFSSFAGHSRKKS